MELDFCQNVVWYACRTVETKDAQFKCYNFSIISEQPCDPKCVKLEPVKLITEPWLFGPATDLKTRTIIYPCSRFKCLIPCPCLICEKKNPSCSKRGKCSCEECKLYMLDHQSFHATFHFGCVSCEDIVRVIPNFNFFTLDKAKKEFGQPSFDDPKLKTKLTAKFFLMWKGKRESFLRGEESDTDFWCNNCHKLHWSFNDLRDHILKKHSVSKLFEHRYKKNYRSFKPVPQKTTNTKCYECLRNFISVEKLHIHMESVHYGQSFDCDECGETFTRKDSLHRHRNASHTGENFDSDFKCNDCSKQFSRKETLRRHIETVHMVCKYCGKQFVKKRNLQTHIQGAHEVNANEQSKCEVCGKHFEDEENYKKHNECIKTCKFCPEIFCTSRAMDAHMNSKHTFFHCEFCGQEFSNESNLRRHLRMRTSKPKAFKACGSVFCNLGTLKSHMILDHS